MIAAAEPLPSAGKGGWIAAAMPGELQPLIDQLYREEILRGRDGSTFRVEIFHLADDPHHQELFRRRMTVFVPPLGETVWTPKPEDLAIQKLRWARKEDLDDARNILAVQGPAID